MADYDAKAGDYAAALDWLAVAALFRGLTPEYCRKKTAWELSLRPAIPPPPRQHERGEEGRGTGVVRPRASRERRGPHRRTGQG
jgi:hypothetical protein